ncbi:MAG: TrkH family potassium uptake protein, partial [Clostridiales bacterium]|nr:TrkH family potassium uptake protein [Clostridiales bacterium]
DEHSMHLMRAEVPGPQVGKLVPRIKNTAMILYGLYIVLTIIEILLLLLGGMSFFDSVVNSFATAGTGGFSIRNASIAAYDSVYAEIVMTVFMALFGINFNLMFFLAIGRFKDAIKSEELRVYIGIIAAATILITLNILPLYDSFGQALRYSSFQVSSVITTTGFITANYELWPQFSQIILLIVMFIGACAGSTGGGLKISRIIIMVKSMLREIMGLSHRRLIKNVRFEGKTVDEEVVRGVNTYFTIYCILFILFVLVVSLDGFDFKTTVSSVITCINNVGPGLGIVGPVGNFSRFSGFNKLVLSLAMLTGRLEIFPIIMLFTPSVWKGLIKVNRQHNSNNKTNMI